MKPAKPTVFAISALLLLDACATAPTGPTVEVLPGKNKPFEAFQQDQAICQQYAHDQTAGEADRANERALGAAAIGTVLGAGLGAAVGGGRGAAIGAAGGAAVGTGVGADNSNRGNVPIQVQYNNAYSQCMYSKGNQVIGPRAPTVVVQQPPVYYAPPPPVYYAPPPPVYYAPPPPPVYVQPQ